SGGNVGIGTTTPQQRFTLASSSNFAAEMANAGSPSATLAVGGTLTVGTAYYYEVTALDGVGETTPSVQVSQTPTSGNQTINLSWLAPAGAVSYKVYRTATSGVYNSPALIGSPTTTSFSDSGLT